MKLDEEWIEEIDALISECYAASMKAGLSAYLLQTHIDFYKKVSEDTKAQDYEIMTHCRDCHRRLHDAIKAYGGEAFERGKNS